MKTLIEIREASTGEIYLYGGGYLQAVLPKIPDDDSYLADQAASRVAERVQLLLVDGQLHD